MAKIDRVPWYTNYYSNDSNILNLSNNVCYDRILFDLIDHNFNKKCIFCYPDGANTYIALANYHAIDPVNIAIGYGAGDIIHRLLTYFSEYKVAIHTPTYELAGTFANNLGMQVCSSSNLDDLDADILYIANPNGVTGNALHKNELLNLASRYRYVIADEAYGDFSTVDHSVLHHASTSNIIVVKTFSKSIASPGLRFGYCISNSKFIADFQNARASTVISGITEHYVMQLIPLIRDHVNRMFNTRFYIEHKYDCYPSNGNYVLFKSPVNFNCRVKQFSNYWRMALTDITTFKALENGNFTT